MNQDIRRPSLWLHLSEIWRATGERRRSSTFLKEYQPEAEIDRRPILVIPGFMASEVSTKPMRRLLNRIGYKAIDWNLGRNYANLGDIDQLADQLVSLHDQYNRKITIIGWSLGGLYARRLGMMSPDLIEQVITLAAPYRHIKAPNYANWLFQMFQSFRKGGAQEPEWVERLPLSLTMPTVAFYSKTDGIVPWQSCMDPDDHTDHQNIEVTGSHIGLGMNEGVLRCLLHVLEDSKETLENSIVVNHDAL